MKPSDVLQNGSFNNKSPELINLKCVTYTQPIPLSLKILIGLAGPVPVRRLNRGLDLLETFSSSPPHCCYSHISFVNTALLQLWKIK